MGIWTPIRKRRLRKDASQVPTGFIPLREVSRAAVLIDSSNPEWSSCGKLFREFCSRQGISPLVAYADFRKFNKEVVPETPREVTFTRKDLNIIGRPKKAKASLLVGEDCDVFLCLSASGRFCIEYLSKAVRARFKVGRKPFDGETYNLVVAPRREEQELQDESAADNSMLRTLETMLRLLGQIG
ncbi:MAG: DUF6913 domain-containing protein [Candidatus Cryptobacteroides sp.]